MNDWLNTSFTIAAGLNEQDQQAVQSWLSIIVGAIVVLVTVLVVLALFVRLLAKRSTKPCPWCMEFISMKETVCPRCGKSLVDAPPSTGKQA
ncbi:MAG TPA: hypothetical protein VGP72_29855 [Planctomycetota bacterium]|jgi:undecaprenyl pyrophosphate phosphatase UppP